MIVYGSKYKILQGNPCKTIIKRENIVFNKINRSYQKFMSIVNSQLSIKKFMSIVNCQLSIKPEVLC